VRVTHSSVDLVIDLNRRTVASHKHVRTEAGLFLRCAAVLPAGVSTSGAEIGRIGTGIMILEDTKGHGAHAGYCARFEGGCDIVVVRPDGIIGAVVRGPAGLEHYFSQIFNV
jgi:hypothetical protein